MQHVLNRSRCAGSSSRDALALLDELVTGMEARKAEHAGQVRTLPVRREHPLDLLEFDERSDPKGLEAFVTGPGRPTEAGEVLTLPRARPDRCRRCRMNAPVDTPPATVDQDQARPGAQGTAGPARAALCPGPPQQRRSGGSRHPVGSLSGQPLAPNDRTESQPTT